MIGTGAICSEFYLEHFVLSGYFFWANQNKSENNFYLSYTIFRWNDSEIQNETGGSLEHGMWLMKIGSIWKQLNA